jgi:hypothetical protein
MENHEMAQIVAHQLRHFTMVRANKPLYKCPIHRINLSTMTSVAMVTDTVTKRDITIKTVMIDIITITMQQWLLPTLIDPIHYRVQLSNRRRIKWPLDITRKTDEQRRTSMAAAVKIRRVELMAMREIIIVIIHKRLSGPQMAVPIRQISILCQVSGNIRAKL